jgi:protein-S-isoprenylcysteine O-methyltransferase Ste14
MHRSDGHDDRPGVIAPPPVLYFTAMAVGYGLGRLFPLTLGWPPWVRGLGGFLMACSVALAGWGSESLRRAGTNVDPNRPATTVVQSGPYRWSRNPLYLSMTGFQIGLGALLSDAWMWITLVPLLAVMRHGVIDREEQYLERKFGEVYIRYKNRVRRWI